MGISEQPGVALGGRRTKFMRDWLENLKESQERRAELKAMPLIERNGILLAELEREWSVLGPVRPITYTIYIGDDEKEARNFARETESLGFDARLTCGECGAWSVEATRSMEPTAANVTHWEEWFNARLAAWEYADDNEGSFVRLEGWRYPKKEAPAFSLEGRRWSNSSARDRGRILFGETLSFDRVSAKGRYGYFESRSNSPPFRIAPSQFLANARARRPVHAEPTASKFAQWLYSLYADAFGSPQDREDGKQAEEAILAARRRAYSCVDDQVLSESFPDWRLVHNGMHMAQGAQPNYFAIDDLRIAGEALRVLPDLVYRNQRTGEILIVEIKHSRMAIPSNLWPNIWGQLWCYAQLEQVRRAPRVTVVGEIWGDAWTRGNRKLSSSHLVCLRASVRRDPRAAAYDRFFRALFDIYRAAN